MHKLVSIPIRSVCQALLIVITLALLTSALPSSNISSWRHDASAGSPRFRPLEVCSLILTILCFAISGACYCEEVRGFRDRWLPPRVCFRAPTLGIVAAAVLAFGRIFSVHSNACEQLDLNPDIGGLGTRLGLELPIVATAISLMLGRFTSREMGTKELGLTNLASMLSSNSIILITMH